MGLLHEKLTYNIRGCLYEVQNKLGLGFDEESYHLALEKELSKKGIPFESKISRWLKHRGTNVHKFIADIVVDDKVILELKSHKLGLHSSNFAQIIAYLKNWNKPIGFLVNFGLPKVEIKRVIFTEKPSKVIENYSAIHHLIRSGYGKKMQNIRNSILSVYQIHGTGYTDKIYSKLLNEELSFRKINFRTPIEMPLTYKGEFIRTFDLRMPLIENELLCGVIATREFSLENDILDFKNYLNKLSIPFGILAHFGKDNLDIIGVSKN